MAGERHVLPSVVVQRWRGRGAGVGGGGGGGWSRRRESGEGGGGGGHAFSIASSSAAFSRSGVGGRSSWDDDLWQEGRISGSGSGDGGGRSSGSSGSSSATRSLRLAFHGSSRRGGERAADAVAAARGDVHGRRSVFISVVESEGGSSRSRTVEHFLEAPESSSSGGMLPGVEVARRRRVRIAETNESGGGFGGGGHESGHGSRYSRGSGVTVAHHHHHYHHHHHHHVHHQPSRNSLRPGTPRPGSLVRRMQDILQEHRARSPLQHFNSSLDRANSIEGGANSHGAHRSSRGHGHRSGEGETRIAPLSSLWRRQSSSDSSRNLRGAALEARNRLDERLRAAAHASHSRPIWQAVQSSYDMNLLFSDDEEENLWSDDDGGWETSLHEWLSAWAPSAEVERWRRGEPSSGRASNSRNPSFKPRPSEGLSKAAINALPLQVVGCSSGIQGGGARSKMEQEECPVCLEGFVAGQSLISLPCNHRFHPECLTPWLASHGQCPYCRADIVKDNGSTEQKSNGRLMGETDEDLLSWVEAIERGMDRLSYS